MSFKFVPIQKGRIPTTKTFKVALEAAEAETARYARNRFKETVKTWDDKPDFKFRRLRDPGQQVTWEVFTKHEVYFYVNEGTEPHLIFPKSPGGVLAFPSMYGAKSKPGFMGSFPGGASGDMVFTKFVNHPGVEPRRFDVVVAMHVQKKYFINSADHLRKAAAEFS